MTAGNINPNTTQAADLQSIFAGAILDEVILVRFNRQVQVPQMRRL